MPAFLKSLFRKNTAQVEEQGEEKQMREGERGTKKLEEKLNRQEK
jgi:hypothetical protein